MPVDIVRCNNPTPVEVTNLPRTAFREILVGQLYPQFQGSFEYTVDNTDLVVNTVVNGGTVTQALAMAVVATSTTTASTALLSSARHAKYKPGIGTAGRFTALFTTPVALTEQYIGFFDTLGSSAAFRNGFGVGYDGEDFGIHRFSNDVKYSILLSACDDPLDGSGASGMTLDTTKLNVFAITFQYLGGGPVRYYIEDESTGGFVLFHTIVIANTFTEPIVHNPSFHFLMFVNNKATTSNLIIKCASYGYFNEGITTFIELHVPHNSSGLQTKNAVTTEIAIFTIRSRTNYAGVLNFIDIFLEHFSASIEANAANNLGSVRVIKNTTLGGTPVWNNINTNNSTVEIDVAGTTVTGGKEVAVIPLAGKNDKGDLDTTPFKITMRHGESFTVAGKSAASATINAALLFSELF